MKYITENKWEAQDKLKAEGYRLVAPKTGCFRNKKDAESVAIDYKDSYIICHSYDGRIRGYMVYAR